MGLKKGNFFVFAFLVFLRLPAIAGPDGVNLDKEIKNIASTVFENPVSAKTKFLNLLKGHPDAPDSIKASIYLQLSRVYGMTNSPDSALWAVNLAISTLPDNNLKKGDALNTKAIIQAIRGEFDASENTLKTALLLNDSLYHDPDLKHLLLQSYASLCRERHEYVKASHLLLEAIKTFESIKKSNPESGLREAKLHIALAESYSRAGSFDFAMKEFRYYLPTLLKLKDRVGYCMSGINMAETLIKLDSTRQADSLLHLLLPIAEELENDEQEAYVWLLSGKSKSAANHPADALSDYRKAFSLLEKNNSYVILECAIAYLGTLKKTNGRDEALRVLGNPTLKTYAEKGNMEERLEFNKAELFFRWDDYSPSQLRRRVLELQQLQDSVSDDKQKQSAMELLAKYNFEKQELANKALNRENEIMRKEEVFQQWRLYSILFIAALLVAVLLLNLQRLRQRTRFQENEISFQKQRVSWVEKEKVLQDHLVLQHKNLLTRALKEAEDSQLQLEQIIKETEEAKRKELLESFERSRKEKLGIDTLIIQFNSLHPTFASSVLRRYPELTQADIQFCALFRMNLTVKEISLLMNIEPRSVYQRKYRVMKKMGLGEEDNLEMILFGMD
jgi:tetratricopeptide (TPR) repeat protein